MKNQKKEFWKSIKKIIHSKKNEIISLIVVSLVIVILLNTGPANAFITGLVVLDDSIEENEIINIQTFLKIDSNEYLDVDSLSLKLKGPITIECSFDINGNLLEDCPGINIKKISSADYEYGYGFTNGSFKYNITIDSSYYCSGNYESSLLIYDNNEIFESSKENFYIKRVYSEAEWVNSLRAGKGELEVENENFGESELNFYVPIDNAEDGEGSLIGQKNRKRIQYYFDVSKVLRNNQRFAEILVNGKYKINRNSEKNQESVICVNKIKNKVGLTGDNINSRDMEISFLRN